MVCAWYEAVVWCVAVWWWWWWCVVVCACVADLEQIISFKDVWVIQP